MRFVPAALLSGGNDISVARMDRVLLQSPTIVWWFGFSIWSWVETPRRRMLTYGRWSIRSTHHTSNNRTNMRTRLWWWHSVYLDSIPGTAHHSAYHFVMMLLSLLNDDLLAPSVRRRSLLDGGFPTLLQAFARKHHAICPHSREVYEWMVFMSWLSACHKGRDKEGWQHEQTQPAQQATLNTIRPIAWNDT